MFFLSFQPGRGEEGQVGRWLIVEKMMARSSVILVESENRTATAR